MKVIFDSKLIVKVPACVPFSSLLSAGLDKSLNESKDQSDGQVGSSISKLNEHNHM